MNDPGENERDYTLPGSDAFQDYGIGVKSLSTTIGTSETTVQGSSTSNVVETAEFFTSFSSTALRVAVINAETWTIAVDVSEGNIAANSRMLPIVYTFRKSDSSVRFVIDAHTAIGGEWNNIANGQVATFSGSAVTVAEDDYLVLEFWRHTDSQAMAMAFTQTLSYDGTVDVTQNSTTSAASYLETPQDNLFSAAARRIFNIS